jgi:NADH dehydrogenase [ubiquinone] 1 alpha subcomplex assembly factor 7
MSEPDLSLGDLIDMQIRTAGPMSLATFMGLCLTHPSRGYYRKADPLGAQGDFITAPEISQMFGEMIGAWIADLYVQMGSPPRVTILELGPGRGTLMADALRVASRAPGFATALDLKLFETNPVLIAMQRDHLAAYDPDWIDELETIADAPVLIIANEFFDALPIRQFVRQGDKWFERCVGLDDGRRVFGLSPNPYDGSLLPAPLHDAPDGAVAEIALAATQFMGRLAALVAPRGGAILAIDYGYERTQPGETLQALSRHAFVDPLAEPGNADLTTHVDFEALGYAARMAGLNVSPLVTQATFLTSLGLDQRARTLASANPALAQSIESARSRLVGNDQMGALFKVLCAASPGLQPAGLPPSE